jgi:DNA repair protein RecO (recombination protein O)
VRKAKHTITEALVAKNVNYGEADRICTLLTSQMGKVTVLARSARKSRKRFGGALSLFVIGKAILSTPSRGELLILERFDSHEDLGLSLGGDVIKIAHGSYVIEAARELWPASQVEPALFELVCSTLRMLVNHPPCGSLLRAFELQLLAAVGLAPSLHRCVTCGKAEFYKPLVVSPQLGGILCANCSSKAEGRAGNARSGSPRHAHPPLAISSTTHRTLSRWQRGSLSDALEIKPPPTVADQAREVMLEIMRFHLGKELNSMEFLYQLARKRSR